MPVSTSPVPAVASAFVPVGLMCTGPCRRRSACPRPLSSVVIPVRSTNSRIRSTRVAWRNRSASREPRELARVRRHDARLAAQQLELLAQVKEPARVDDGRQLVGLKEPSTISAGAVVEPKPGPDRDRAVALRDLEQLFARSLRAPRRRRARRRPVRRGARAACAPPRSASRRSRSRRRRAPRRARRARPRRETAPIRR